MIPRSKKGLCVLLFMFAVIGACFTVGCDKWKLATVAYEGVGEVMNIVKCELETLHDQGKISEEDFVKLSGAYNNAVEMYQSAKGVMKEAMKIKDTARQANRLEDYFRLIGGVRRFVTEFITFLKASGIDTKKIDDVVDKYSATNYQRNRAENPGSAPVPVARINTEQTYKNFNAGTRRPYPRVRT